MYTIVLATQKGGSGKSTLAVGLALAAKQAGHIVRLIETDRQGTLMNWQTRRGLAEPIVETVFEAAEIEHRLEALARGGVTLAIIDTAGGISATTTAAIRHADLCLIPSRPSVADIEVTGSTLCVARAWKKPFAYVLNQTPIRGRRIGNAATTLADEAALELANVLAQPFVVMRNDHQDALAAGLAVGEYAPTSKSAAEIRDLWQWTEAKLTGQMIASDLVAQEAVALSAVEAQLVEQQMESPFPIMFVQTPAQPEETEVSLVPLQDNGPTWDACL
jgi:chromosome partitioning protein